MLKQAFLFYGVMTTVVICLFVYLFVCVCVSAARKHHSYHRQCRRVHHSGPRRHHPHLLHHYHKMAYDGLDSDGLQAFIVHCLQTHITSIVCSL